MQLDTVFAKRHALQIGLQSGASIYPAEYIEAQSIFDLLMLKVLGEDIFLARKGRCAPPVQCLQGLRARALRRGAAAGGAFGQFALREIES
jgi:hypothetical protein